MSKKSTTEVFCCDSCNSMQAQYIGDGFDEFYDYYCSLVKENNKPKLIGCHDTFDPPITPPKWCPKVINLLKDLKGKTK